MSKVSDQELQRLMARAEIKQIIDPPPRVEAMPEIEELTRPAQGTFDRAADQAKARAKAKVTEDKGSALIAAKGWPKRMYPLRMNRRRK